MARLSGLAHWHASNMEDSGPGTIDELGKFPTVKISLTKLVPTSSELNSLPSTEKELLVGRFLQ
jgi:hypothetical protein